MKTTCYHARGMNGAKTVGGSLSYSSLDEGARFIESQFDVIVQPSGRVTFAQGGKPVDVYLSVDPAQTEKGRAAIAADRAARNERQREIDAQESELQCMLAGMSTADAIAKLKG